MIITLKFKKRCSTCLMWLQEGDEAEFDPKAKTVRHVVACLPATKVRPRSMRPRTLAEVEARFQ